MAYTEAQMRTRIQRQLSDSTTAIWSTAMIADAMRDALVEIADYEPNIVLATVTTAAGTKTVSIGAIPNILYIDEVEFPIDKDPRALRTFNVKGSVLMMDLDFTPDASENVRLYVNNPHNLYDSTGVASTSTLPPHIEGLFADLVSSRLAMDIALSKINTISAKSQAFVNYQAWGERKLTSTLFELKKIRKPRIGVQWPRDR